ncbi:MAG: polyisoprenoid-binding protein [Actinobacteria bacterium]|nr:MAG: polyisoprenoid-binding protein [Actinomycetota bacterium]TML69049.1 MAG: polyisoprenoid-binding protein [Actinomycetota bacterium]
MSIVAQKSASIIPTGTWTIDPVWSALGFEIKKIGLAVIKGRALDFEGTIRGGDAPSIEGKAAVSSITTFDETRDAHLQSPDFFDAERYPELRFESTRVEARGNQLIVDGELTIKGVATPVELRGHYEGAGTDPLGNERIALELSGTIDRTDFGLDWNAPVPGGGLLLPNEVVLTASFAAVRAA